MTAARKLGLALLVGLGLACKHVETAPGLELTPAAQTQLSSAVDTAAFWNPSCDRSQIVVQRVDENRMMAELSICGDVRRYQFLPVPGGSGVVWLDVTSATSARPAPAR